MGLTLEDCTFARAVFTWAARSRRMSWAYYDVVMRNVLRVERRLIGCEGKDAFVSAGMARKVAKKRRQDGRQSVAYRCRNCGAYHIGHIDRGLRRARERRVERLLEDADAAL